MGVDFREHDARERGLPDRRDAALEFQPDLELSEFIREGIRAMRDQEREQAAFDAAERRMRGVA